MTENWYEVWANNTTDPPYVLIVRVRDTDYLVIDPKEDGRIAFQAGNYDEVKLWLLEDEYLLVRGADGFR